MTTVAPDTAPRPPTQSTHRPAGRLGPIDVAAVALLFVVTLSVYATGRPNGFIRYDDPLYVQRNWQVQAGLTWAGLRYAATAVVSSNWHPLTLLAEMASVQLFGASATTFHLLSATIHAVNVGLLYLFLRLATGMPGRALAVASLWGLHPLRVESVAWVSELKDVLCGLFWLAGMLAFLAYRRRPGPGRYLAVVGCMLAACLSKPMAVTFPFALLLLDYWPLERSADEVPAGPWWQRRVLEQLPLVLIAAAISVVAVGTQAHTHAMGSLKAFPFPLRCTNALDACRMYLLQTVWPAGLANFYPHPATLGRTVPAWQWLTGAVLLTCLTGLTVSVAGRRPYVPVGWFWFVGTLVPVIGLVHVGILSRADRYTYLPSIGLTLAIVWSVADLAAAAGRRAGPAVVAVAAAVAAVALTCASVRQVGFWRDDLAMATRANDVVPDNWLAQASLAVVAVGDLRPADAVYWGQRAAALAPREQEAHHSYAAALAADRQWVPAAREFERTIRIDPFNGYTRSDFAAVLMAMHREPDAVVQLRRATELQPDLGDAHQNLGVALAATRDYTAAAEQFRQVIAMDPTAGIAHGDLANILQMTGDRAGATAEYWSAVHHGDARPETRTALVWLLATSGNSTPQDLAAVAPLAKAACDDPANPNPAFSWYAYSVVLARQDRFDDAIAAAQKGLALARAAKQDDMATHIENRLAAYRRGLVVAAPPAAARPTTVQAAHP